MKITDFKNIHEGERCFILGNGPSLNDVDVDSLDGITFGTNRIFLLEGFEPDYYVTVDPGILTGAHDFHAQIKKLDSIKFISEAFALSGEISLDANVGVVLNTNRLTPAFGSPEGAIWEGHTVTFVCLQLAYYMGFTDVVLLGVDHSYKLPTPFQENCRVGEDPNHFSPNYRDGHKEQPVDLRFSEVALTLAKKAFDDDGRTITNCSASTKLDIFPVLPLKHHLAAKPPRVSALVSAYKSEEFFVDCIFDLMEQTLYARDELEIVVICQKGSWEYEQIYVDGPVDRVPVTMVVTEDIPSVFEAWNLGAKAASGEYLTYANTDDRHDPGAFEVAADIMDARAGVDLTYHDSFITWERNQSFDSFKTMVKTEEIDLARGRVDGKPGIFMWPDYSLAGLKQGCFVGPQPMWRANLHQKFGYFDPDYPTAGDYEFWLRFAADDNLWHIPYVLGLYLARWDGIEMGNKEDSDKEAKAALNKHYGMKTIFTDGSNPDPAVLGALPIKAWPWPRPLLYVPMFAALPHAADVFGYFMAIATQGPAFINAGQNMVGLAREKGCQQLMDSNFTHIVMLDADHQHQHDIIQRLCRWVIDDPEKLIIGGLNFRRGEPYDPCAFIEDGEGGYGTLYSWEQGLVEVDYIGFGAIIIAREALERIKKPWFYCNYPDGVEVDGSWYAEDIHFCKKAGEAGIKIYCDTTTTSPHMISGIVDESTFRKYIEQNKEHEAEIIPNPKNREMLMVKE